MGYWTCHMGSSSSFTERIDCARYDLANGMYGLDEVLHFLDVISELCIMQYIAFARLWTHI